MKIDPLGNPNRSDLNWLAEQYVLGDLASVEAEAFESRLAVDQTAREAVASAALLLATYSAAAAIELAPRPVIAPSKTFVSRVAWFSGVAAAVTLAAFLVWQSTSGQGDTISKLAGTWSETREPTEDESNDETVAMAESAAGELAIAQIDEVEVPDWLMTAVSLHSGDSSDKERSPVKPEAGEGA